MPSFKRLRVKLMSKKYWFIYVVLIGVIILSALKISGSSIGMYDKYFTGSIKSDNLLLGTPRAIRSDEWLVQTPLLVSQINNNFKHSNIDVGLGQETALIYEAPNNHWSTLFRPHNWSFFILPPENAFAFKWWIRGAFLIISTYLVLLFLTKDNIVLSAAGALFMFFSPFVQWWYAVQVLESIYYVLFALFVALKIFTFKNTAELIIYPPILAYFLVNFAITLYPPFQVATGVGAVMIFVGYVLNHRETISKERLHKLILAYGFSGILFAGIIFGYYLSLKESIQTFLHTSYPGKREISGGGYTLSQFFGGFYNVLLQKGSNTLPPIFGNQTEASSFFMIFIFVLPVALFTVIKSFITKTKVDWLLFMMIAYFFITLVWLFWGFTPLLGKLSLFYLVPENRMIIGIGMVNIFFIFYVLSAWDKPKSIDNKIVSFLLAGFSAIVYVLLGQYLVRNFPGYIQHTYIILVIATFSFVITFALLLNKRLIFILSLGILTLVSSGAVNPLMRTLSPITKSQLSQAIKEIEATNTEGYRWVNLGNIFWGNYIAANGGNSLNGTHLHPQLEIWKNLDPEGTFDAKYNRYSHVVFKNTQDQAVMYENPVPDTLVVTINPCNSFFEHFNVKYYLSQEQLTQPCLTLTRTITLPNTNFYVYERE
jgi:hypothetical protein